MPLSCNAPLASLLRSRAAQEFCGRRHWPFASGGRVGHSRRRHLRPHRPAAYGAIRTKSIVLRHPESQTTFSHHREPEEGLLKISVDEVVSAARFLLGSSHA